MSNRNLIDDEEALSMFGKFLEDSNPNHDPKSGEFTFAEGGSPVVHTIASDEDKSRWRGQIDAMQRSLEGRADGSYSEQEAAAIYQMDTVLDQDEKAKLSERKDLKFAYAEVDGKLVAAGSMRITGKTARFQNLGSLKRGAGRTVMESLIATSESRGVRELGLEANKDNQSFYERLKFHVEGDLNEPNSIQMRMRLRR